MTSAVASGASGEMIYSSIKSSNLQMWNFFHSTTVENIYYQYVNTNHSIWDQTDVNLCPETD